MQDAAIVPFVTFSSILLARSLPSHASLSFAPGIRVSFTTDTLAPRTILLTRVFASVTSYAVPYFPESSLSAAILTTSAAPQFLRLTSPEIVAIEAL